MYFRVKSAGIQVDQARFKKETNKLRGFETLVKDHRDGVDSGNSQGMLSLFIREKLKGARKITVFLEPSEGCG